MSPTKDRESFKHQDLTLFLPYLKPFNGSLHSQKKKKKKTTQLLAVVFVAFQDLDLASCSILILTKEANAVIQRKEPESWQRLGGWRRS